MCFISGLVIATILSLIFIVLLRFLAGIMVWVMIVMVLLVIGYGNVSIIRTEDAFWGLRNLCVKAVIFLFTSIMISEQECSIAEHSSHNIYIRYIHTTFLIATPVPLYMQISNQPAIW